MYFTQVCLCTTLLVAVLTWAIFHVSNRSKKTTKLVDTAVQERRDGGPDVIIVGAGVGGSALAYALAKVIKIGMTVKRYISITLSLTIFYSICTCEQWNNILLHHILALELTLVY